MVICIRNGIKVYPVINQPIPGINFKIQVNNNGRKHTYDEVLRTKKAVNDAMTAKYLHWANKILNNENKSDQKKTG